MSTGQQEDVRSIARITHEEAMAVAAVENARFAGAIASLGPGRLAPADGL